ncbi:unnamed protein product [Leptosia nina]|uniref:Kelch domain-containing protein 3 n=1 Tax=Leptosia nina TaxID=320188 RepID=A0AAV1JCL5_9NEOP
MYWTLHTEGGPRRVNHAAVCVGDKIYSFGGYCSVEDYRVFEPISVHVLDITVFKWSPVEYKNASDAPFQRYGHSCVGYGDKIYMWGGRNDTIACYTVFCFDTKTLEWSNPTVTGVMPNGKDGHSACIIGNKMYIFGGFDYLTDQYTNNMHYLNLDTMDWSYVHAKGTPPLGRDFHTALAYGDRMYIFGGRADFSRPHIIENEIYCDNVYYFNTTTETWVMLNTSGISPDGRRSHSGWIYNDFMYIFGGYNEKTKVHYNDVYRFSLKRNYWEPVKIGGTPPSKRRRQVCILKEDKVYLFGGTSPGKHPLNPDDSSDDDDEKLLDNNDLHILDYNPTLKVLCINYVLENNLDISLLPKDVLIDIRIMTQPNRISRPINQTG